MNSEAPVAQLDRALPSEGKGHTFESCRVRHSSKPAYLPSERENQFAQLAAEEAAKLEEPYRTSFQERA